MIDLFILLFHAIYIYLCRIIILLYTVIISALLMEYVLSSADPTRIVQYVIYVVWELYRTNNIVLHLHKIVAHGVLFSMRILRKSFIIFHVITK